jgi:hypothetical protein
VAIYDAAVKGLEGGIAWDLSLSKYLDTNKLRSFWNLYIGEIETITCGGGSIWATRQETEWRLLPTSWSTLEQISSSIRGHMAPHCSMLVCQRYEVFGTS